MTYYMALKYPIGTTIPGGYGTLEWRVNPGGSNTLCGTVNQCVEEYDTTVLCL